MTNTDLLKQTIDASGVTIVFIAEKLGCSRGRVYAIMSGSECTASEIVKLGEILHLTPKLRDSIFLSGSVTHSKHKEEV